MKLLPDHAILIPAHATKVFTGVIFDVYQWAQELYDGSTATFEMLKRPDSVMVVAVNDDNTVVVLEQHQPNGVYRDMSLPGGRVDPGESPLQAAQRELREEAGIECAHWKLVSVTQPESKIEWFVYVFVASDITSRQDTHHDAGEKITIKNVAYDDFLKSTHAKAYTQKLQQVSLEELKNLPEVA